SYLFATNSRWWALVVWVLSTLAGLKAGGTIKADSEGPYRPDNAPSMELPTSLRAQAATLVALVASYIFLVGLVALVSVGVASVLQQMFNRHPLHIYWEEIAGYPVLLAWPSITVLAVALLAVSLFISSRMATIVQVSTPKKPTGASD